MTINNKILSLLAFLIAGSLQAQDNLTIHPGTYLNVEGANIVLHNAHFTNNGNFTSTGGIVQMTGNAATSETIIGGTSTTEFSNLTINKTTNVLLDQDISVSNELDMTAGLLNIQDNNITITETGSILNASSTAYVQTAATGNLVQTVAASDVIFPVGENSYTPLTLNNAGTSDTYAVRARAAVLKNGSTGTEILEDVVDRSWYVEEGTQGGSDLTLTTQWSPTDELTGFDRSNSSIHQYTTFWEPGIFSTPLGTEPFSISRSGITTGGVFAVGGSSLIGGVLVDMAAFLEGPYDGTAGMNDNLRTLNYIPTEEPYTNLGFTHVFRGGGETVVATVLSATGNDAVIDWVFVELRDSGSPSTVLATKSALLLADGRITDLDGSSQLTFEAVADGDYYVSVKHRNHLGVMTSNALSLSRTASSYDFSTGNTFGTSTQKLLPDGLYGLFSADVNADGSVDASDRSVTWNFRNVSGYTQADATMDGSCDAADRSNAWNNRNKGTAIP